MSKSKEKQEISSEMSSVVVTDCGSTTSKAVWFEKTENGWRQTFRAEAPTTVEKPVADVTIGVKNALSALELVSGRDSVLTGSSLSGSERGMKSKKEGGPDYYFSTSSAGGGLQMVVLGIVQRITGKTAERAALGAGAIVLARICLDDEVPVYLQAERIRELRPDIILLSGGTDGGATDQVRELAEMLLLAEPRPRFGEGTRVPVIYAGNNALQDEMCRLLGASFDFKAVSNLRPIVDVESLEPARESVHDVFLEHVMSQAPGYRTLSNWVDGEIMPTPVAVSQMIEVAARHLGTSILAVDIGGATTDIFSIRKEGHEFSSVHRTVSANLGMSYSIGNVIDLSGVDKVSRWLSFPMTEDQLTDALWNKMFRPTTIPQTLEELEIEHAVSREALRLSFEHHKSLSDTVEGSRSENDISKMFRVEKDSGFNIADIEFILGSGGVLSHAPNRASAALMLIDSFQPKGITFLGVDSIFMLPHLGVFSRYNESAALEVLLSSCIVELGTHIAPVKIRKRTRMGEVLADITFQDHTLELVAGSVFVIALSSEKEVSVSCKPRRRDIDFGAGPGEVVIRKIRGGEVGLVLDGRNALGESFYEKLSGSERASLQAEWSNAFGILSVGGSSVYS
ncbi:MAG TPA: glutamate mutase L [Oligoflexia bacterium]|nr:glutamate mutase L [Oligoflexia bacterium]HMP49360.1 glutamate mutase L [Oligoflexia bacterium]